MIYNLSKNIDLKWQFKEAKHIKISTCKKIINTKTGRIKKEVRNGGSIGFWILPKLFIKTKDINSHVELIEKIKLPF